MYVDPSIYPSIRFGQVELTILRYFDFSTLASTYSVERAILLVPCLSLQSGGHTQQHPLWGVIKVRQTCLTYFL